MLKTLRFFTIAVFAVGLLVGFYLWPAGQVVSEPGNSPLYTASLNATTTQLNGPASPQEPTPMVAGKGGGQGNFITCEITCGPTCNQTTCGTTCVATCASTCANTCAQTTCNSTCVATCASTCANTCSQATCASTCVVTCSYTCIEPISLVGLTAEPQANGVVVNWTTGSEVDNYSFVLWRSTSLEGEFSNISGQILAQGHEPGMTNYSYTDHNVMPGNTYYYKISDISTYGYQTMHQAVASATVAAGYVLAQNFPNPFNPETVIRFVLPAQAQTQLAVYDISGRLVRTLVNSTLEAGAHSATFDGSGLSAGMYIYRLTAGDVTVNGKMVLVK
jgi:hypothetical protein